MIQVANNILILSFIMAGYGAWSAFMGGKWRREDMITSAERSAIILFILSTLLIAMLLFAFITRDFSLKYVASYSSSTLPLLYTISALWAGQAGSLLLWVWLLSLFSAIVVWQNRQKNRDLIPFVMGVLLFTTFFFFGLIVYASSPFELLSIPMLDGKGLNPMLQNSGMIIHPPTLYLGYVGFTVPFAFAIAALLRNKHDNQWIRTTRRWTLFSWLFLTLGNLFGAKWAYVELGWGGYWAWDPVENASLMPWLTGTAFLHSVMIQEKRGMLKVWNLVLIIITFALTIFGTFITRSGIISSIHSFGVSNLGPLFLIFLGIILLFSFGMLWFRRSNLRSENHLDSFLSRESSFLFNNLLLVGMAFAVFWGTIFPIISEAVRGVKLTVGPPFFNQVNLPFAMALLALTGICPLIAWRKASKRNLIRSFVIPFSGGLITLVALLLVGIRSIYPIMSFSLSGFVLTTILLEFYRGGVTRARIGNVSFFIGLWDLIRRNKRRYGGYVVHLGVIMIFVGITGSSAFQKEKLAVLQRGEFLNIGDYSLHYQGLVDQSTEHAQIIAAEFQVSKNGRIISTMLPSKQIFPNHDPVSEVDIRQTLKEDLYLILSSWDEQEQVTIKALVVPLIGWIWIGGTVMIIGTLIAIGPDHIRRRRRFIPAQPSGREKVGEAQYA